MIHPGDTVNLHAPRSLVSASLRPPAPGRYLVESLALNGYLCRLRGVEGAFVSDTLELVAAEEAEPA